MPVPAAALPALYDLHVLLHRLYGVHVAFHPPRGRLAKDPWDFGRPWLCDSVRRIPGLLAKCDASEALACREASRGPKLCRCHAGLDQFVVPVRAAGRPALMAIVSPLRGGSAKATASRVAGAVGSLGYDREMLDYAAAQLPVLGPGRRAALARFIREAVEAILVPGARARTGIASWHSPVRAAGGGEPWVSFLWAGFEPQSEEPREGAWHRHRSHEVLLYARRAPVTIVHPRCRVAVPRGRLLVLPAGTRYRREGAVGEPAGSDPLWVHFVTPVDLSGAGLRPFSPDDTGRPVLERLVRAAERKLGLFDMEAPDKLRFLAWVIEMGVWSARGAPRRGRPPAPAVDEAVERVRTMLESRPGRPFTLPDLAREAGMNIFTLSRRFRAVHGLPPLAWQRQARARRAVALLKEGRFAPKAVAVSLGWRDLHAFGRAIRAATGLSPRALVPPAPARIKSI